MPENGFSGPTDDPDVWVAHKAGSGAPGPAFTPAIKCGYHFPPFQTSEDQCVGSS